MGLRGVALHALSSGASAPDFLIYTHGKTVISIDMHGRSASNSELISRENHTETSAKVRAVRSGSIGRRSTASDQAPQLWVEGLIPSCLICCNGTRPLCPQQLVSNPCEGCTCRKSALCRAWC